VFNEYLFKKITQNQLTAHTAKALVLNCMDFRLIDDMVYVMDKIGLNNNYDNIVLAGCSLHLTCGNHNDKKCNFNETFNNYFSKHLELAKKLHDISKIIIVEHEECGAYKKIYDEIEYKKDMETYHKKNMKLFYDKYENKFKELELEVEFYMIDLKGKLKKIIL
jgi:carbonic anhydrase